MHSCLLDMWVMAMTVTEVAEDSQDNRSVILDANIDESPGCHIDVQFRRSATLRRRWGSEMKHILHISNPNDRYVVHFAQRNGS